VSEFCGFEDDTKELRSSEEADRYLTAGKQPLPSATSAGGELTNIITLY